MLSVVDYCAVLFWYLLIFHKTFSYFIMAKQCIIILIVHSTLLTVLAYVRDLGAYVNVVYLGMINLHQCSGHDTIVRTDLSHNSKTHVLQGHNGVYMFDNSFIFRNDTMTQ